MIVLKLTCGACPEQYDAYDDANGMVMVGYLRLRHGAFRVDFPDCGGETIFEACPRGDGEFYDDERDHYLKLAVDAIEKRIRFGKKVEPDVSHIKYRIDGAQPGGR